jgi:Fe-S-cluster containining protein
MRKWLCLEKWCFWCCDPVKIIRFTLKKIPKDKTWKNLRILLNEQRIPKTHPDTVKIDLYKCLLLDKKTWLCKDYQNRPEICKNSWCINPNNNISDEEQYTNTITTKFYKNKINKSWK